MIVSKFTDRSAGRGVHTWGTWVLSAISVVLGLVWGSAAASGSPLFPGAQFGTGWGPWSVAIADLDGDGDADLAVAKRYDDNVSILLNQSAGGDLDGDGDVDLDDLAAFVDCVGGPGAAPNPPMPNCTATCLGAFDFDADGDVDLFDFAEFQVVFTGLLP